jgi:hypothetical protein
MSMVTREQVLERVAGLGPLQNVFLITKDDDTFGVPVIWYPEIGLRYLLIEKEDLAQAVYNYLREAGVRRFKSETELQETQRSERWEGWDTCEDYRRIQQVVEQLARKSSR